MTGRKPKQLLHRLAAEEDVGADRQIVGQRQILVDRLDAVVARLLRTRKGDAAAVEFDVALIVVEHARDRLDDGRLAGAVVAGQRHHLAGMDLEGDFAQGLHAAEVLGDVADGEDGGNFTQLDALP